jgi:hypothetical protein
LRQRRFRPDHYHGYEVRLEGGAAAIHMWVTGSVNFQGDFRKDGDLLAADLDGNDQREYFRSCTNTEGVDFTIWTGKRSPGGRGAISTIIWAIDVSATCTVGEHATMGFSVSNE